MSQAHRRVALIVCPALATAAVAAIPALATNVVKIDSKLTISTHAPAFHGKVKSDRHACETGRVRRRRGLLLVPEVDEGRHVGAAQIVGPRAQLLVGVRRVA